MSECPAPLVPADVDLRNFGYMPLELQRLRRSRTWLRCRRQPEIGFYTLNLWASSWHEIPAGSLEDDDDVLADAAMCAPDRWATVRGDVLTGWTKCSDGRWYHRTVAEKAAEAWAAKCEQRLRTLKGRIASMEKRLKNAERDVDREHIAAMLRPLKDELAAAIAQSVARSVTKPVTDPVTAGKGEREGEGRDISKGEGRDLKKGILGTDSINGAGAPAPVEHPDVDAAYADYLEAARRLKWTIPRKLDTDRRKGISRILKEWDGLVGWRDALAKAEASDFLSGRIPRSGEHANWRVDLDFLLNPKKFRRLAEGGYGGTSGALSRDTWAESLP
jgi:hypothetical protein